MAKKKIVVPELAALKAGVLEQEVAALPEKPSPKQLEEMRQRLDLPGLESIEVPSNFIGPGEGCEPSSELLGLEKAAGQKIRRVILNETPTPQGGCRSLILRLATAFTGYGAYSLSFWKKAVASEPDLFNGFFRDISALRGSTPRPSANWHRTILFQAEGTEGIPENHQQLMLTPSLAVCAAYLTNLKRFVDVANTHGVIVQVCLFHFLAITGAHDTKPPTHFPLSGTDQGLRFRTFCKVGGQHQTFQSNMITAVTQALKDRPNVVWEVGNELRIPGGETTDYKNADLTAWINWVAQKIRQNAPQLISTSTGLLTQNERPVNQLPSLDHCSFHLGQWRPDIAGAVNRAASYSDRHVVIDTDGANGTLVSSEVQGYATTALSGVLKYRASFDHKSSTPVAVYDPSWLTTQGTAGKKPLEFLTALSNARAAAGV